MRAETHGEEAAARPEADEPRTQAPSKADRLVAMANQIARELAPQGEERAVPQIADHMRQFWDPRMRARIREHLAQGGEGLSPLARQAVGRLG